MSSISQNRYSNFNKSSFPNLGQLNADCVSFTGKEYSIADIKEPTGHCAYCGEKVYTNEQLIAMSKEILNLKGSKLQGKIRSIEEKLAKNDSITEIAIQKREVNSSHIDFFDKLAAYSYKKPTRTAGELLQEYSNFDKSQQQAELMKHLKPLLRTIEHVSPQRKDLDNTHSDFNLVEACYTCNHDIKQGLEFSQFYDMYPSIKDTMPHDKFEFACANIIEDSKKEAAALASAESLLKQTGALLTQYKQTKNSLGSISLRLSKSLEVLTLALQREQAEKKAQEDEISDIEKKYEDMIANPEYKARNSRQILNSQRQELLDRLATFNASLSKLNTNREELSDDSNGKKSKLYKRLSPNERKQKLDEIDERIAGINQEKQVVNENLMSVSSQIASLDSQYTPIEVLQEQKANAEAVVQAYEQIEAKRSENANLKKHLADLEAEMLVVKEISSQRKPDKIPAELLTDVDKDALEKYKSLLDLLSSISSKKRLDDISMRINAHAINDIERQIKELASSNDAVAIQEKGRQIYKAGIRLKTLSAEIPALRDKVKISDDDLKACEDKIKEMTLEDAKKLIDDNSNEISRIEKILSDLRITERIQRIRAEIRMSETTIKTLQDTLASIESELKQ